MDVWGVEWEVKYCLRVYESRGECVDEVERKGEVESIERSFVVEKGGRRRWEEHFVGWVLFLEGQRHSAEEDLQGNHPSHGTSSLSSAAPAHPPTALAASAPSPLPGSKRVE